MMKTDIQKIEKSTIEQLLEIRDKISSETQNMTFEQLKKYIDENLKSTLHPKAAWRERGDIVV
jgi:hypothetical protein